jgi:hypothetical protein
LGKRRTFHERQLSRPIPRGVVPFPPGHWPWKAMTSLRTSMTSSRTCGGFWEAVVARVAASEGPRGPNVFLQEANVALKGANVTLKEHDIFIYA